MGAPSRRATPERAGAQSTISSSKITCPPRKVQAEIRRIVDIPDRLLRLFVRVAVHNGGRISATKRSKFDSLTDAEVAAMEAVVQQHLPQLAAAADLA